MVKYKFVLPSRMKKFPCYHVKPGYAYSKKPSRRQSLVLRQIKLLIKIRASCYWQRINLDVKYSSRSKFELALKIKDVGCDESTTPTTP